MRLLERKSDGEFCLTEFLDDNLPLYAILSHRWGPHTEEVTFRDIMDGTGKSKAGYGKIRFCGQQAERDGLQYFWVDTCCINKADFTELSEAINSMFRWYYKATKCYVFMSDVSKTVGDENDDLSRSTWKSAFRKSEWFTRGWTLQELIAPASVEFFSLDGDRLGDKRSMEQQIHDITGISIRAFRGEPLSTFSFDERMSWAKNRSTTRKEDKVYSLLGIFDIHMALIYGEGEEKAVNRLLEEINKPRKENPQDARLMKIRQWLSPPDPSLNYQKALKQRQADTGLWFLESEQYDKWKTDPTSFLWLYGIPGCGKTILSSTILQNLFQYCAGDPIKAVAYFYFDFNDKQKKIPELMIRSLICQLLQQYFKIPIALETIFSSCENGQRQPLLDDLLEVLHQMILELPQLYIVLDALDESDHRAELMEILERIRHWQLDKLHLLVTSRRERDIENSLEKLVKDRNIICLQSNLVDIDIRSYVHHRLSVDRSLSKWQKDSSIVDEIETTIMKGAHGMFRWAVCQLDALSKCLSRAILRKVLGDLPATLDITYERILTSIDPEYTEYALRILQWLTFSARPLLVEEVAEVLAIDVNRDPAFDREEVLEDPLDVLQICSSLITIAVTEESNSGSLSRQSKPAGKVVLLAHYSVKEYLISERCLQGPAKRYGMQATICNQHVAESCIRNSAYLNWARIYNPDEPREGPDFTRTLAKVPTPLYFASLNGLTAIVELLLSKGADINTPGGGRHGNAFQAASYGGHTATVELLLSKGADVNAPGGGFYGNALQAASYGGHTAIIELLLSKGADVNASGGGQYGNALQAASAGGHTATVELLLSKGADVNASGGGFYGNALQTASYGGHTAIVELLLSKGADVNASGGGFYGNALQAASAEGHTATVELLQSKGADVNASGGEQYGNALQTASARGHTAIIELLLSKGADVNASGGGFYGNALQAASAEGHTATVELLQSKGADVNASGGEQYGNALQAASAEGHTATVELLLSKGADVNAPGGGFYGNALRAASARGHTATVELLLSKGAKR